jgi:uncharacterized protein (TIGR03790 family)
MDCRLIATCGEDILRYDAKCRLSGFLATLGMTGFAFGMTATLGMPRVAIGGNCFRAVFAVAALFLSSMVATSVIAGGGPENVLLLVNANSETSKTIANHYIELRKIPPTNVVYIDWKGSLGVGSAERLKNDVLDPVIKTLDERKLTQQIDYLVYSSDFPYRVELQLLWKDHKFTGPFDPFASVTGATYLLSYIIGNNPAIVSPNSNWYVPGKFGPNGQSCTQLANVPSRGFRSRYLWDESGNKTTQAGAGQRYLLSTMLGVTQGRGNTVDEVLAYLRRSAAADGTRPNGTMYYMWNKDIRSTTRDKCFEQVAAQIKAAGVKAEVKQGILPNGAKDVAGLMVGASDFSVPKAGIAILPGAICEHLTSNGGVLVDHKNFQTPLSEFLRYGAAGASGTVAEPRAIQAKFPLPSLQLHYARGCSLAEAFYQSISGPYQLLIVGDPLCQPWAAIPKVFVAGVKANDKVKGTISVTPSGVAKGGSSLSSFELFVDGKLVGRSAAGGTAEIDTTKMADGYHELRFVGVDSSPIETQGRQIVPITVANHDAAIEVKTSSFRVKLTENVRVSLRQAGATSITIRQNSRDLASVKGEAGDVEIAASKLGRGPNMLQAISDGPTPVISAPWRVLVD